MASPQVTKNPVYRGPIKPQPEKAPEENDSPAPKKLSIRETFGNLRQHAKTWAKTRAAPLNASIKNDEERIKNLTGNPIEVFLEANTLRFKIIAESVFEVPFEFVNIGFLINLVIIGFLWILVWAAVESIALHATNNLLVPIWIAVRVIIAFIDYLAMYISLYILGPFLEVLVTVACSPMSPIPSILPHNVKNAICTFVPNFSNPEAIKWPTRGEFIAGFWSKLSSIKVTCAELSTGISVFEAMFKLIFSPEICPIIQHTRPVGWLHDMFYYSLGWASWSVGIRRSYESPLARAVAEQKYTNGIRGSESCDEPEDAFFCFMFGVGFMLLEIMAPLILFMFVLHPLRHLIKSIIGIAFSLVYYSTDITIYFIEKLMSSINWAGKRGAWIVVSALPILVCTIVGYSIFSNYGLAGGAFVGGIIGGTTSVVRAGKMIEGPGTHVIATTNGAICIAIAILAYFVGPNRLSMHTHSHEWAS